MLLVLRDWIDPFVKRNTIWVHVGLMPRGVCEAEKRP